MRDPLTAECAELLDQLRPLISREAHMHLTCRGPSATLAGMLRTVLDAPDSARDEANEYWTQSFHADPMEGLSDAAQREFVATGIRRSELLLSRDALAYLKLMTGRDAATALAILFTADDAGQGALSSQWAAAFQSQN
ncbi:hypothetical protein EDF37_2299 [Frondihabitans sp. PhB153]|nr:hypothetical protein EDF37_2299 [Frondihabitans sp. PhB153]